MSEIRLRLERYTKASKATHGKLRVLDECADILSEFHSLELPWRNNEKGKSCIPEGEYIVRHRFSQKYKDHLIVLDAETKDHPYPRTFILIHPANYVSQLRGCIALGLGSIDMNGDEVLDVTNSRKACERLLDFVKGDTSLIIIDKV